MLNRIRPFLFTLFVGLFFTVSASILGYAFGYRFSFARGIFIYTGSITIKSTPQSVDIAIDGGLIPKARQGLLNNSVHITGLAPGEHSVTVSAPGYRSWFKKVVVRSGLSTEFWNVLLVRDSYPPRDVPGSAGTVRIFPAPKNDLFALVKQNGSELTVDRLDTAAGTDEQIFSVPDATFPTASDENLEWTPESTKLLVRYLRNDSLYYAIVDLRSGRASLLRDLAKMDSRTTLTDPRWDAVTRDFLIFIADGDLYRLDTSDASAVPRLVKQDVLAYDVSGANVYYLSAGNGVIYRVPSDSSDQNPEQITDNPIGDIDLRDGYTLVAYDSDRIALLDRTTGTLRVSDAADPTGPYRSLATDAQGMQFSNDGKKLLFFTDREISVYFLRPWDVQPVRQAGDVSQIARFSVPVRNAQWTGDYEHVLFALGGDLKIIELDNRDRRNLADMVSLPGNADQILVQPNEHKTYLVVSDPGKGRRLVTIDYPETVGFFGF